MQKARIVFMGTPSFATASLKALQESQHEVVAVVTVPDKPAGRGQKMNISDVKAYALEQELPILQPEKLKNPEFIAELKALNADIFVVVAFRMLPKDVWSIPTKGTFNLHASLLPQYRGAAPINHAVINGETKTGVTTFLIDEAIDTGNIILRKEEPIYETDTAGALHDRLMILGAGTVVETIDLLISGNYRLTPQSELVGDNETLHPAPKLFRESGRIQPNKTAREIHNMARGLSPYPGSYIIMDMGNGEQQEIKVFETYEKVPETPLPAGKVHSDGKDFLCFGTAHNSICINKLQSPGKKRLDVKEWLRGIKSTYQDWRVI